MVSVVGVSKLGRTHLIFVDPGIKINGAYYRDVLLKQEMLPISVQFLVTCSFFSRTMHRPETVALLQREVPAPNLWTPNSPNLNPVHYKVWGTMPDRDYRVKVQDVDDLKQRLIDVWDSLAQSVIDAIDQWRSRLCACVRAKGGHFEQSL